MEILKINSLRNAGMQVRIRTENLERTRIRLGRVKEEDIMFDEPHFSLKLEREKIDLREVIRNLQKPDKLVFIGVSESKNPNFNFVYDLYFKLSKNRIFKIPAVFKAKSLYLITIFKIRRKIQNEASKYYRR